MKHVPTFLSLLPPSIDNLAVAAFLAVCLLVSPLPAIAQSACTGPLSGQWWLIAAAPAEQSCTLIECDHDCMCKAEQATSPIPKGSAIIPPMPSCICHEGSTLSGEFVSPGGSAVGKFSGTVQASGRPGLVDDIVEFVQTLETTVCCPELSETIGVSGKGTIVGPGEKIAGEWQLRSEAVGDPCVPGPFVTCTAAGQFETIRDKCKHLRYGEVQAPR